MIEHEYEPVRGLPAPLPKGERILWQGRPDGRSFAIRALHLRGIALYFGIIAAWTGGTALHDGAGAAEAAARALGAVPPALAVLALIAAYVWLVLRSTVYTVTTRRVVIRFGIALPMAVNIPYAKIAAASLRLHPDGTGDIPLTLVPGRRVSFLLMWPHVRPWRTAWPQPMLRSIPGAAGVAERMAEAMAAVTGGMVQTPIRAGAPAPAGANQDAPVAGRGAVALGSARP